MSNISLLLELCDAYAVRKVLTLSRISTVVFNDGKVIARLKSGADITVGRLEGAIKWFDAHWPDDLPWPEGLARPSLLPANPNEEAA
jgi:hypothetical protein